MSSYHSFDDDPSHSFYHLQRYIPESWTSSSSYLWAIIIAAFVLFKSLEVLGYPVYLWLYQGLQMATDALPITFPLSRSASSSTVDDSSGGSSPSSMQSRGASLLGSVFGLGSGLFGRGISGISGSLSTSYRNVPAGLGNWDNSCYQNSVIQGLASLPSLRDYLDRATSEHGTSSAETTNDALFDMIDKLNNPENHGQNFWIRGKLKSMSTFQQQDAQEYYSKILDALDKEARHASSSKRRSSASWLETAKSLSDLPEKIAGEELDTAVQETDKPAATEQPQIIPNPLDGLLAQRVGCVNCGYTEGLSLIPFNCITVPLGKNWMYDVRECLDEYTHLEYIEGVECAKCTLLKTQATLLKLASVKKPEGEFLNRLKNVQEALEEEDFDDKTLIKKCALSKRVWVQSTKSRQAVIARAPKSLVLHVNRSIFDEMTGAQYKNNAQVLYPKILDLGNWCLGTKPSQSQQPDDSIEEAWPRDPNQSMLGEPDLETRTDSPFQYRLRAAITHFGNHGNGHYVCYRQHPFKTNQNDSEQAEEAEKQEQEMREEQWWRLSDENVHEVSEEEALRQGKVFMLFYERSDEEVTFPPAEDAGATDAAIAEASFKDVPLPPVDLNSAGVNGGDFDYSATEVPLPDDDLDEIPLSPPASPHVIQPDPSSPVPPQQIESPDAGHEQHASTYPTPPPDTPETPAHEDTELSETDVTTYDSEEGAPSTLMTSDDERPESDPEQDSAKTDASVSDQVAPPPRPHRMRTAGDVGSMRGGAGQRLPMRASEVTGHISCYKIPSV
ncbi:cysteine proteinase [Lophiostoma macrostomum CBS 122681]|uniref:ubiquitinyl hydrolase 1 n=1 Tax=Lophiostoma macrostomum CBS 122681 TaxID=1314788 RepID=A0A6A6TIV2_9PLEO|nr:cysteine proteinase [Lophiostoma macrostomum CBS 122681]